MGRKRKYKVAVKYCFISNNKHIYQRYLWKGDMRRPMDLNGVAEKGHFDAWLNLFDYSVIKFRSRCWTTLNQKSHSVSRLSLTLFQSNRVKKMCMHQKIQITVSTWRNATTYSPYAHFIHKFNSDCLQGVLVLVQACCSEGLDISMRTFYFIFLYTDTQDGGMINITLKLITNTVKLLVGTF